MYTQYIYHLSITLCHTWHQHRNSENVYQNQNSGMWSDLSETKFFLVGGTSDSQVGIIFLHSYHINTTLSHCTETKWCEIWTKGETWMDLKEWVDGATLWAGLLNLLPFVSLSSICLWISESSYLNIRKSHFQPLQ